MRTLRTTFKALPALIVLALMAHAQDTDVLTPEAEIALNCFLQATETVNGTNYRFRRSRSHLYFSDVLTAPETGGWTKCPAPGPEDGFPICTNNVGCSKDCFPDSPLNPATGECTPYPVANGGTTPPGPGGGDSATRMSPNFSGRAPYPLSLALQLLHAPTHSSLNSPARPAAVDAYHHRGMRKGETPLPLFACRRAQVAKCLARMLRQGLDAASHVMKAYCCSYKPDADEKECIVAHRNETKSEFDCGADAGNPGFLAADPVRGCVCEETLTPNFCGVSIGDPDAEMMCSDTTDSSGHREVKCRVNCSEGFTATEQTTCEVVEVEGETVTMAGTTTPRDDFESRCTDKVIALPGKRGCLCATEVPAGAEECPGVGPKEYAICGYVRGENDPAFCATNCIRNTFRRGPQQRCT
ncbi:hypothetical protein B0H13DRAFT_1865192 [Mycena leptocephala]|nr:hypothetical protein B0H13DRAFT_1865192 [Mycena leptocephala]